MARPGKKSAIVEEEVMEDDFTESEAESDSEFESDSEDEEEGDIKLAEPSKTAIFNREGLIEKLQDISWPENVDWIHRLSINVEQENEVDVNDDLTRELAFYTQALEGTREAFGKLESMGLPFLRPPDYYAEMVKTDSHMEKVKGKLLAEKKKIEEAEQRKRDRESKKISKEVQATKQKERAQQKKQEIESVKKWRKQRQRSGFPEVGKDDGPNFAFEDGKSFERSSKKRPGASPWDRSGGKAGHKGSGGKGGKKGKNPRDRKDSKFGHGGRKGMRKQNTAETTNDFRGFNKGDAGGATGNKRQKR